MATCQKLLPNGQLCGRDARWLCLLDATYDAVLGRLQPRIEHRCNEHKDGEARRVGRA